MELPTTCQLVDRTTGERVPGLIRLATDRDLLAWTSWRYRPEAQDKGWDWRSIYQECKVSKGRYECYAVLARDELQGLMLLDLKPGKTGPCRGLLVDYPSTNPTNRKPRQGLKHIGAALITVAVLRSQELGAEGFICLESLAGAERFYENLGMTKQPRRSAEGNSVCIL